MECSGLKWNEVNGLEIEEDGHANGIGKEKVSSAPPSRHTSRKACHAFPYPRHTIVFQESPRAHGVPTSHFHQRICCRVSSIKFVGVTKDGPKAQLKSEETYFSWFGFDIRRRCHVVPFRMVLGRRSPLRDAKFQ